jgi:FkbM family methyltransferase
MAHSFTIPLPPHLRGQSWDYEAPTSAFFSIILEEGDGFVDVGANGGHFSFLAAEKVGLTGAVWAFEPHPVLSQTLRDEVVRRHCPQVEILETALGADAGKSTLFWDKENNGGHTLHDLNSGQDSEVKVTRLDAFEGIWRHPQLRAMKINCEGSESRVLEGAGPWLRRQPIPYVVVEINRSALELMGTSEKEIRAHLARFGYESFFLQMETGQLTLEWMALNASFPTTLDRVFNLCFIHEEALKLWQSDIARAA